MQHLTLLVNKIALLFNYTDYPNISSRQSLLEEGENEDFTGVGFL